MQIILAQNSEGNRICFGPGTTEDLSQPLMELIQMRHAEGWYKESPSAMDFVRRLMDAYYQDQPFIMINGEEAIQDPDFEGLALDFLESRGSYAKEKIEVLETEN